MPLFLSTTRALHRLQEQERLLREKERTDFRIAKEREREIGRLEAERKKHMEKMMRDQVSCGMSHGLDHCRLDESDSGD
jgi:hypothetical protein